MLKPRICAVLVSQDISKVKEMEKYIDFFEVRIDLIGDGWQKIARTLNRPWIACNRRLSDGGNYPKSEEERVDELFIAAEIGATLIDIELNTTKLNEYVSKLNKSTTCLLSFHDLTGTPPLNILIEIVNRQIKAGADICKLVTTAKTIEDNYKVLQLIQEFPHTKIISFGMGTQGTLSRILAPLAGSYFTYASLKKGQESASGQLTVEELTTIYNMIAR
jgi:3-dehydroquinate dehydratase-1